MKKGLSIIIAISLLLGGTLFFGCEKQSEPEVNVSPEPATAKITTLSILLPSLCKQEH